MSGSSRSSISGDLPDILQLQKDASVLKMVKIWSGRHFSELAYLCQPAGIAFGTKGTP